MRTLRSGGGAVIPSVVLCVGFAKPSIHYSFRRDGRICCTSERNRREGRPGRRRVAKKGGGREGWTSKFITGRGRCPPASRYIYIYIYTHIHTYISIYIHIHIYFLAAERVPRLKSREQKSPWRQRNSILMNLLCFSCRVPRARTVISHGFCRTARAAPSILNSISPHNYPPFFEFPSALIYASHFASIKRGWVAHAARNQHRLSFLFFSFFFFFFSSTSS